MGDGSLVQPCMGPWDQKRSWVQTLWCVGETLANPLLLRLAPGANGLSSGVFKKIRKKG
jgi:hypothetical protein